MKMRLWLACSFACALVCLGSSFAAAQKSGDAAAAKEGVLKAADVGDKLFPDKVFFRGQSATVQGRNSAGVRYSDGFLLMAALVDSSGYSSGLKEKYQGFLINEVPIEIGGQTLKPGQYGFGFVEGNKFIVMDVGANDVLQASSTKDAELKRPVPLQVVAGEAGKYRLYKGRDYVEFSRGK
jgi:GDSL-like Lipase/Acylhydrolase